MSKTAIPLGVRVQLWARSAGRCEFEGCNQPLWRDDLTKKEFTSGYVAHVVADSPSGPRGDPTRSPLLATAFTNLMLLCGRHHDLVDDKQLEVEYPEARLLAMKAAHERRIELACAVGVDMHSHILLYGPNIGAHQSPLSPTFAAAALLGERYPADSRPITLDAKDSSLRDSEAEYWVVEDRGLVEKFDSRVRPLLADASLRHASVFALAPQPLLIRLGALLTDITAVDVYQYHREPQGWRWPNDAEAEEFIVQRPAQIEGPPALVLSFSATIAQERITKLAPEPFAIWHVTIPTPRQDFVRSREQLRRWRERARLLMDEIKAAHGQEAVLHVFPAVPVSIAVELGRIRQPKADLKWRIYDEDRTRGGFKASLDIG